MTIITLLRIAWAISQALLVIGGGCVTVGAWWWAVTCIGVGACWQGITFAELLRGYREPESAKGEI